MMTKKEETQIWLANIDILCQEMGGLMGGLETSERENPDDPRYTFDVGDKVIVDDDKEGEIIYRRNGYPKPYFSCWFPCYMVDYPEGKYQLNGEEVGPSRMKKMEIDE